MAFRKSRKFVKRKFVRRKRMTRRKNTGDSKRLFKLRLQTGVTSDASGILSFGISDDPSSANDFASVASLFDEYRVNAMKLRFLPSYSQVVPAYTTDPATGVYPPLYVVYDPNSITQPLSSISTAIAYENMRVCKMTNPWTIYRKLRRNIPATATNSISIKGYQSLSAPVATQGVYAYGTGYGNTFTYGTLITTYYLTAKSRR